MFPEKEDMSCQSERAQKVPTQWIKGNISILIHKSRQKGDLTSVQDRG